MCPKIENCVLETSRISFQFNDYKNLQCYLKVGEFFFIVFGYGEFTRWVLNWNLGSNGNNFF
jgi:hypothetical protein